MKTATLDDRRRLVMPEECPANSAVTIQQVDRDIFIVRVCRPQEGYKVVLIPEIDRLPDDPEWEKKELAFAAHAIKGIQPPEPD